MFRVIIVDDEQLLRKGFIHMADWMSYDIEIVGEASNGVEALELIEKMKPNIVITDIKMPVMDGIELTKVIKEKYKEIEVIILSSYDDFDYVRETLKVGAKDYILKGKMDYKELLDILNITKENITINNQSISYDDPNAYVMDVEEMPRIVFDYHQMEKQVENKEFNKIKEQVILQIKEVYNEIDQNSYYVIKKYIIEICYFILHKLDELDRMSDELDKNKFIYFKNLDSINSLEELFNYFGSIISDIAESVRLNSGYSEMVENVIKYIHTNYRTVSLSSAAKVFHVNKNYLCDTFKQQTKITFNDFLTNVKIKKAKELLREKKHTIYSISEMVGYSDPSYFGQIFKKHTGKKPSEYIKLYK